MQYPQITGRVRTVLIALLIVSLGIIHVRDVLGLFEKASDGIQTIQEKQAVKGRKAAEFYRAVDQMLDQKVQDESRQGQEDRSEEQHRPSRGQAGDVAGGTTVAVLMLS